MYDDSNARYWEGVSVDEIMTSDVQSIADLRQHLSPPAIASAIQTRKCA